MNKKLPVAGKLFLLPAGSEWFFETVASFLNLTINLLHYEQGIRHYRTQGCIRNCCSS
jgi:hypothetical protein